MVHDSSNQQQDVRLNAHSSQACTSGLVHIHNINNHDMYVIECVQGDVCTLTLLQDYYYYKLYEWGVFVPTAVSFSSYCVHV